LTGAFRTRSAPIHSCFEFPMKGCRDAGPHPTAAHSRQVGLQQSEVLTHAGHHCPMLQTHLCPGFTRCFVQGLGLPLPGFIFVFTVTILSRMAVCSIPSLVVSPAMCFRFRSASHLKTCRYPCLSWLEWLWGGHFTWRYCGAKLQGEGGSP
jgi:hypothetical protein